MTVRHDGLTVDWFGYATVRIETPDGTVVYLDPGRYGVLTGEWTPDSPDATHPEPVDYDARDADIVLVSHDHHYDSDGIRRVAGDDATVVVYDGVDPARIDRHVAPVSDLPGEVVRIREDERTTVAGVEIHTVPAHNRPDGPHTRKSGEPHHPEGFGVGYRIVAGGIPVFWPGDSDALDAHADLDVSLFLPPIGGSFTMDRREATDLAGTLDPDLVLPIHYDTFAALETDSRAFAADAASRGVPVVLDER